MKRSAAAIWQGSLKQGSAALTAQSYVLGASPRSLHSRFAPPATEGAEELIAAAHTGFLAMALSCSRSKAVGIHEQLKVTAEITLDNISIRGWAVTSSHLVLVAKGPRMQTAHFVR
jgi:osmotically inducible protein OsmC